MMRSRTTVKPGLLLQPFVISQLTGTLVDELVRGTELTSSEFALASWLALKGQATPTELSRDLGLAPTTLSAMIERLVRKRQVRRARHPDDGRSYVLELTARGEATNEEIGRRFRGAIGRLRANLAADEEEVLAALRTLERALRETLKGERPA